MKKLTSLLVIASMLMSLCVSVVHAAGDSNLYDSGSGTNQFLNASAYSESLGTLVMAGRYSAVMTTQDGVNFGRTYSGDGSYVIGDTGLEQIIWVEEIGKFVVLNADNAKYACSNIAVSKNGVEWTTYSDIQCNGSSLYLSAINYANGEFIGAGLGGNLYTSKNLKNWTKVTDTGIMVAAGNADSSDSSDYSNARFVGIAVSPVDNNGYQHVLMYTDHASFGVKGSTKTLFYGDTSWGDDWYTGIETVSTLNANDKNGFNRIFDVHWSDNGYFYGIGTYGSSGEVPFKYEPDSRTLYRSSGSTYPLNSNNGASGAVSIVEDGDRYVIGTTKGTLYNYSASDPNAFSGVPTVTQLTASSAADAMAASERVYNLVKTKWGVYGGTSKTAASILKIGTSTYDAISEYYKYNLDNILTTPPDAEPTDSMVQVTQAVGMAYVKDMYDEYSVGSISNISSVFSTDPRRAAYIASLAAMLHKYTGEERYLTDAATVVSELLKYWSVNKPTTDNDFFTYGAFVEAYAYVRDLGLIEDADSTVAEYVNASARSETGNDLYNTDNQSMLRARGLMIAAKNLASDYAEDWEAYVEKTFANVTSLGATNENATGYNGLAMFAMYEIAEGMGYTVPKDILENYAHIVAPSGAMPEYGDDYFCTWFECLPALMYYARKYDDGGVWYNADKVFHFGCNNYNLDKGESNAFLILMNLYYVAKAYVTECTASGYGDPGYKSEITQKKTANGTTVPDKLMLRNGDAYAFVDLYTKGAHSNHNSAGAVLYYERDGVPVFHGMARHNKSAQYFSMPVVTDTEELVIVDEPVENEWYTESYPLTLLDPDNDGTAEISEITLRIVPSGADEYLYVDNIRLTGKNGTLVLDSCDTAWTTRNGVFEVSTGTFTEGSGSIRINPQGQSQFAQYFYKTPSYNKSVDLSEYDTLSYDWCYTSGTGSLDFDYIVRLNNGSEYIDFYTNSINQAPVVVSAELTSMGGMEKATVKFENYGGYGINLKREYALFADGTLVTKDSFSGETGKYVHNLQQLYGNVTMSNTTAVSEGEDRIWYDVTAHKAETGATYVYMPNYNPTLLSIGNVTNSSTKSTALVNTKQLAENDKITTVISTVKPSKTGDCVMTQEAILDISKMTPGYVKVTENDGQYSAYIIANGENPNVIIAEYDADGNFVTAEIEKVTADGKFEYTTDTYTKTGDTVTVYVWNDNLVPIVFR